MNLRWPDVSLWRRQQWAVALVALLLVTLTPLTWIQWRQYQMLDDLAVSQVDSLMWQAFQLERELEGLKHSLQSIQHPSETVTSSNLSERYGLFLSHIKLLTQIPRTNGLAASPEFSHALTLVNGFAAYADPVFQQPQRLIDEDALRQQMIGKLGAMAPALSELTRQASGSVARFVKEHNDRQRQQGWLVMALAAGEIAIMLLFVVWLVRHSRRQHRQAAELRALNVALDKARDQAEAANQGKTAFLANMSHEVRTPFQGMIGMLDLLDDDALNHQQRDYMQTARDSAMHLLGVLNDIHDVSSMEFGTLKLAVAPVHLPNLLQEVDALLQESARVKGVALHMQAADDLPQWVNGDAARLRQIMLNLTFNAIKFTEAGSVTAELAPDPQRPPMLVFTVRDTGIGMDAEARKQLFTRYYQADNSLRRRMGGTGLGLEISRHLARMMGGDIEVQSTLGVGSTFTVALELAAVDPPGSLTGGEENARELRKLRVLVADDHPINLKYITILLEKMGHEASFCHNGQEALHLVQQQVFDLVLLDYHMPVLDGLAATEAIRALEGPRSSVQIILVTADVVNDTRKRARDVGVNEFVSKPLQVEELQSAIARCGLLGGTNPPSEAAGPTASPPQVHVLPTDQAPEVEHPSSELLDSASFEEILQMMPPDSLDELLKTVFDGPDGTAHVLAQCILDGDRATTGDNAHKLKGAAMLMGFRLMAATAAHIEHLALQTDDPIGRDLSERVLREARLTQKAIARFHTAVAA